MKTPQDQVRGGRGGGGDFPKLCVDSNGENYLSKNSQLTICCRDDSVNK